MWFLLVVFTRVVFTGYLCGFYLCCFPTPYLPFFSTSSIFGGESVGPFGPVPTYQVISCDLEFSLVRPLL